MEYVYASLLLYHAGKEISEERALKILIFTTALSEAKLSAL
jgi:ribosomal protein L12E/L44/L45/RPP1/RPP2